MCETKPNGPIAACLCRGARFCVSFTMRQNKARFVSWRAPRTLRVAQPSSGWVLDESPLGSAEPRPRRAVAGPRAGVPHGHEKAKPNGGERGTKEMCKTNPIWPRRRRVETALARVKTRILARPASPVGVQNEANLGPAGEIQALSSLFVPIPLSRRPVGRIMGGWSGPPSMSRQSCGHVLDREATS